MNITEWKDLLGLVSGAVVLFAPALGKSFTLFNRRDFFSRAPAEKIKAVKWLRQSQELLSNPLEIAEQQFRLQSFGLHRDKILSIKVIAFYSVKSDPYLSLLKTVLRWPGLYRLDRGDIHLRKQVLWILPLMFVYLSVVLATGIMSSFSSGSAPRFFLILGVSIAAMAVWSWMATCAIKIFIISKELNAYKYPLENITTSAEDLSPAHNEP